MSLILLPILYRIKDLIRGTHLHAFTYLDDSRRFHKFAAIFTTVLGIVHAVAHQFNIVYLARDCVVDGVARPAPCVAKVSDSHLSIYGISGYLLLACFVAIGLASIPAVRRRNFELFFRVHHLYIGKFRKDLKLY